MKKVAWLTDIHLDFLSPEEITRFVSSVLEHSPDTVLIGGDIGLAGSVAKYLEEIERTLQLPIYFVLGNHDFYYGSITEVREKIARFAKDSRYSSWLSQEGVVEITESTGLVGHDSWADGRCGNYEKSTVMLNDYLLINELTGPSKEKRLRKLNALGDEAAMYLRKTLEEAFHKFRKVMLLTHVPPFIESCWHQGKISDDNWLPHFTCHAVGEVLREIMQERTDCSLTVLCGHTHGEGQAQILENLLVLTGGAEYYAPKVQRVFEVT